MIQIFCGLCLFFIGLPLLALVTVGSFNLLINVLAMPVIIFRKLMENKTPYNPNMFAEGNRAIQDIRNSKKVS